MTEKNKIVVKAKDVMRDKFIELDGLTTVKDALMMMKENNANIVIVKKRNDDDEYGLVLLSDIAKKVLAKDRSPGRVNVYEIMSKPVITVLPGMDVRYCARLFDQFGLSVAPVLDSGNIVGIVGYQELVLKGILVENDVLD
jgi:predicted transcriptional regulator